MRELWIGQLYGNGLRECVFIDDFSEWTRIIMTDEQAREFAQETASTIREGDGWLEVKADPLADFREKD
jgi:hypothetical protein